ncbi:hypothetical protein EI94DRAFT_1707334 [Lactarius quietus]|nr:hypothetical protein EI94DRAFT_1707334 [Lactarius quietus]
MPPKQKPPPPTTQQISGALNSVISGIEVLLTTSPDMKETVHQKLLTFTSHSTIAKILGNAHPPTPIPALPANLLEDVKSIKATLSALQKAILPSPQAGKPPQNKQTDSKPLAPVTRAKGKTQPLTFANAVASPPHPSIVVSLANCTWPDGKPSLADLCKGINSALDASDNNQTCISATRWTARDNMILTRGPNTTTHQLQLATSTIHQHFTNSYLSNNMDTPPSLPVIQPNVKWSKILINSVPTGVSPTRKAMTPEECQQALTAENPYYATLNVTQKPSWVRNPNSYSEEAVSLLVVAFEDPDGSHTCALLSNKVLYVFGHCATLRKWKQHPTLSSPPSEEAHNTTEPPSNTALDNFLNNFLADTPPPLTPAHLQDLPNRPKVHSRHEDK